MTNPIISGAFKTFRDLNSDESFLEYEGSTITVPMRTKIKGEWRCESIKFAAFMRLEVFPAYINGLGTREFQFVIHDWELYGFSTLLNELFMGNPYGYPPEGRPDGREQAVITFNVSNNYRKIGDDDNRILASAESLEIDNLTSHDLCGNCLFWQVDKDPDHRGKLRVIFHNRPPDKTGKLAQIDPKREFDHILAMESKLDPGANISCKMDLPCTRAVARDGNSVISKLIRPRRSVAVRWQLGKQPEPGSGQIRRVSPARSLCTADQAPDPGCPPDCADFPARIIYAINYNIFVNKVRFVEDQAGIALAVGVREIPPRDVRVAFDKPHAGDVLGQYLEFREGTCTGMHDISSEEFYRGVEYCRYWRSARLDTGQGKPPGPPPPTP